MLNASTSSDEFVEAASPVFTLRHDSKTSSKSTSILEIEEQPQNDGVPAITLNEKPLNLEGLDEVSCVPAETSRQKRRVPNLVQETLLTLPPRKPRESIHRHGRHGESSSPGSTPAIDFFRLPIPVFAHAPAVKQPLTTALLKFLAPRLMQWRLLTFYGSIAAPRLHTTFAEDAHECLASEANQINSIDWSKAWGNMQKTYLISLARLLADIVLLFDLQVH